MGGFFGLVARRPAARRLDAIVLFVLTVVVREAFVLSSPGGVRGVFGYDGSVYYAAADSLLQGRLPYRDFTLLHPPGMMLALTPFAAFGRLAGDHAGFMLANAAFVALAGVNAALVHAVLRRVGTPRWAALLGGVFYAAWFGAVQAEVNERLEPLGSFLLLLGAFLLVGEHGRTPRRLPLAGAVLGAAVCVKVWYVVPAVLVLLAAALATRRLQGALRLAAGAVAAAVVLVGVFFVAAPTAMWRMIVTDQVGRRDAGPRGARWGEAVTTVSRLHVSRDSRELLLVVTAVLGLAMVALAARTTFGRVVSAVLAAQLVVLFVTPTYFFFYSGYVAPAAALLVGTAAGATSATGTVRRLGAVVPALVTVGAVAVTAGVFVDGTFHISRRFPAGPLADRAATVRCVVADSPAALIQLNVLSRGLRNGCPNWVDVSGRSYDVDRSGLGRRRSPLWQREIRDYLRSGQAALVIRGKTGLSRETRDAIRRWPVLARHGTVTIYRTP
ncbi:Protein of unknown function [Jatrophihabitans endophyticus]|uniref:Dolichyl-phosphate-mannose-protein mannosyltransferase n=1 Tax=Jatrophihabitans endophyticus TaxID=1206085 RepID=A0A1M5H040_9ACTN|nr:glycosyltransferase 87 family protein [Jatrophihabitans endophyticus]SHG09314.1 Protein of unknown function [Jatrophihabitans endophyticus]